MSEIMSEIYGFESDEVCNYFVNYFKLFGKNRVESEIVRSIGTVHVFNAKYRMFERGQFGWWKDNDRVMFVMREGDDSVMLYNYDSGKYDIDGDNTDVYLEWYRKIKAWLGNGKKSVRDLREAGYVEVAEWNGNADEENDNSRENVSSDDDECRNEADREYFGRVFLFHISILFYVLILCLILTTLSGNGEEGRGRRNIVSVNGFVTDDVDYYCTNGVCISKYGNVVPKQF